VLQALYWTAKEGWDLILGMQTLGMSDSTPRSESRLKSLFWPSIESGADVDYLAVQGYWVCTFVATLSSVLLFATSQPILAVVVFLLFHTGGVGVREHSRFAATIVFVYYVIDLLASFKSLVSSPGGIVLRVIIMALLLSNLRAALIAAHWRGGSDEAALPLRLNDSWTDKFANKMAGLALAQDQSGVLHLIDGSVAAGESRSGGNVISRCTGVTAQGRFYRVSTPNPKIAFTSTGSSP